MAGASSHISSGRVDAVQGWKPGTLGGLKTLGFSSLFVILHPGCFFGDYRPCKLEVVLPIWE